DRHGTPLAVTLTGGNRHDVTQLLPLLDAVPAIARRGIAHGSGLGKVRWVVERAFAWLHQFKRLRTRHERRADLHQGLLDLARSLTCLRRLRTSF
ncbi:transposase, partial [Streptomyces halstedii]|uniref:transposase n=1 Tax=Streptomyces halstedii TaxID=1944 RepID=UPI00381B3277